MTRSVRMALAYILLLGSPGLAEAASLKVAPGRFIVHNVQPGRQYDIHKEMGLRLTIYNDDDTTRTWLLSTNRPSERGRWETGYAEIPDPAWCRFENDEVTVPPRSKAYANLHLKIPEGEQYYNQHWIVTLGIDGKPERGGISLAVDIRAQIETKGKENVKTRPDGLLGVAPSTVRFEDAAPGHGNTARVVLYNNDTKPHSYTVTSLFADGKSDRKTYLTHSYTAIPDSNWIRRNQKIRVQPGKSGVLHLELDVPNPEAGAGRKWEEILLIQPEEGLAGFVRIQMDGEQERGAGE